MILYAITRNGMNQTNIVEITKISVWLNKVCDHKVNENSLEALLGQNKESKKMQIYTDGILKGKIDAFDEAPLYTNGMESVTAIKDENEKIIWGYGK